MKKQNTMRGTSKKPLRFVDSINFKFQPSIMVALYDRGESPADWVENKLLKDKQLV